MTSLMPWSPFRELTSWHRDIDELFNRLISNFPFEREIEEMVPGWLPAAESFTKDGMHTVRLDLPGVDPKDMDVSVVDNTLIISGQRTRSEEVKEKDYRYRETGYGRFERRLALPRGVDGNKIKANYRNGVLEVSTPLPVELAGKKIPIQIEEGQAKKLAA
ncbi:MAG: ATP-independent chaperone [Deltaproteobacteria bacterium]|nr:ATP-independent chaperone [Deltaproteobacteria bacterium]